MRFVAGACWGRIARAAPPETGAFQYGRFPKAPPQGVGLALVMSTADQADTLVRLSLRKTLNLSSSW